MKTDPAGEQLDVRSKRRAARHARAQALETWAAARERAVSVLMQRLHVVDDCDPAIDVTLWSAVLRLRQSARRERAQAAALRAIIRARKAKRRESPGADREQK